MLRINNLMIAAFLFAGAVNAQNYEQEDSIRTVNELLSIDNSEARNAAKNRSFGGGGQKLVTDNENKRLPSPQSASSQGNRVLAIYGSKTLKADILVAGGFAEGLSVGSKTGECTVSFIGPKEVKFYGNKKSCPSLTWSGEDKEYQNNLMVPFGVIAPLNNSSLPNWNQ